LPWRERARPKRGQRYCVSKLTANYNISTRGMQLQQRRRSAKLLKWKWSGDSASCLWQTSIGDLLLLLDSKNPCVLSIPVCESRSTRRRAGFPRYTERSDTGSTSRWTKTSKHVINLDVGELCSQEQTRAERGLERELEIPERALLVP
jgi:hypothetical protein